MDEVNINLTDKTHFDSFGKRITAGHRGAGEIMLIYRTDLGPVRCTMLQSRFRGVNATKSSMRVYTVGDDTQKLTVQSSSSI